MRRRSRWSELRNLAVVEHVQALANKKGCTLSQLALAWVLARGNDVVPIPGTSSIPRLEGNVAASSVELTADDLRSIESFAPQGIASGDRYAPELQRFLNG